MPSNFKDYENSGFQIWRTGIHAACHLGSFCGRQILEETVVVCAEALVVVLVILAKKATGDDAETVTFSKRMEKRFFQK